MFFINFVTTHSFFSFCLDCRLYILNLLHFAWKLCILKRNFIICKKVIDIFVKFFITYLTFHIFFSTSSHLCVSLCVCLVVCVSVFLLVYASVCLCVCWPICIYTSLSLCQYVFCSCFIDSLSLFYDNW